MDDFQYAQMPVFQAVAIMEALINPNHYAHAQAKEQLAELQEQKRLESIAMSQDLMRQNRENMSDSEWSRLVD